MQCARSATNKALLAALAIALAGCGVVRPSDAPAVCPSYEQRIRPLVESRCQECHGPSRAEGGYAVGEYVDTLSRRDDGTARVEPGSSDAPFLKAARGELPGHQALEAAEVTRLTSWVVECRGSPNEYQFHPRGWSTPTDQGVQADGGANFHGQALRQKFYRFNECQNCHGDDFRGGKSGFDCHTCHTGEQGPLACNTCHGDQDSAAPPRSLEGVRLTSDLGVGAHREHLTQTATHKAFGCAACHQDVKSPEDEGHYRALGVFQIDRTTGQFLPAEVRLTSGPAGQAKWDRTTATCTNSACHAPSALDQAATKQDPVWTRVGLGEVGCGSCHGAPPSTHAAGATECGACHGGYGPAAVNVETHLNGRVDLKGGGEACSACHSGPDSAQFVDLLGRTADAGVKSVGAHDAHLKASKLRGPMACNECHLVPTTLLAPGHIDTAGPAEVFPLGFTGIASGQAVVAVYDASNATCTNYCHSGGERGAVDTAAGLLRTPSWTGAASQAACGTCHGLPPVDGTLWHNAATTTPCSSCHAGSVQADGGLVFTALPDGGVSSKHLDGLLTGQQ